MRLIKLTRSATGQEIYVNINWIVDIFSDEDSTLIALPMKDTYIPVLESPESIANMIMSGDEQPAANVPERNVGEWIKNKWDGGWHCSCCKETDVYAFAYDDNAETHLVLQDLYCPKCGVKMKREEREE